MELLSLAKYATSCYLAHSSKKVNISNCEGMGNDVCHIGKRNRNRKRNRYTTEAQRAQREMTV